MNATEPQTQTNPSPWHPVAAALAWLLPGLGHFVLGQRQRGAILCVTIGILWLAGMIIGGVSVFDHRNHPAWFAWQALMAPSVVVNQTVVHKLKPYPGPVQTYPPPAYEPSLGRVNEQGVLYTALAGLLNLLAMLDVVYQDTRQRENDRAARKSTAGNGPPGPS